MAEEKLPTRAEDFAEWYNQLVVRADLADYAPVRGCMVVRPYGTALWENIQQALDRIRPGAALPIHWGTYWPLGLPRNGRFARPGLAFDAAAPSGCAVALTGTAFNGVTPPAGRTANLTVTAVPAPGSRTAPVAPASVSARTMTATRLLDNRGVVSVYICASI